MASVNTNSATLNDIVNTKNSLLNEVQSNYNKQSSQAAAKYNEMAQAAKDYGNTQSQIQQQQTDQSIKEINQQRDNTTNDYLKEQRGAYANYAQQVNNYGVNAEKQAAAGLLNSGYSESSKVNIYNTYQNRVMTARDSYTRAVQNYDNQITQVRLANSSALAQIQYNALQAQLQASIDGFKYQNELLNNLTSQKLNINSTYDNLWQSQYKTLLDEAQYNEDMAFKKSEAAREQANWEKEYALSQAQFNLSKQKASSGGSGGSSGSSGSSAGLTDTSNSNSGSGLSFTAANLMTSVQNSLKTNSSGILGRVQGDFSREIARNKVYNQVGKTISESEANIIFNKLGL